MFQMKTNENWQSAKLEIKEITRSVYAKSHWQISGLRLNWHGSRMFWAQDKIEMGPKWFGIQAQIKTGPGQKWDILSKRERVYISNEN